ncbi:hypothetical protein ACOSP7_002213 [Xanthoceras sorbifolium]|uniref:Auxin-responsive protein n=1 Tax=Xanthoceras sorbifolium TaxID=99658 RepID=A0ABQ8IK64_9ROSI|nr:hypothetical protein JRO89_XS01G0197300 [Xanthoceras sorbifolium]
MANEGLGLEITELRLGLPGGGRPSPMDKNEKKRVFSYIISDHEDTDETNDTDRKVQTKTQVVGWPPVCSYRRKTSLNEKNLLETSKMYVKVSMDGAPFLRKIDLVMHKGYSDLAMALEKLFGRFGISEALKDANYNSEYVAIYEDKDGDWMLAGDVPWEMFIESCKRLRVMKRSDAKGFGLQPRGAVKATSY